MSLVPGELKYTADHLWVRLDDDGIVTVGLTDYGQSALGEVVFVELPELIELKAGEESGIVESAKAAFDIYSPINGEIVEVNEMLGGNPELINADPYGEAWLLRMQPDDEADLDELLDADSYAEFIASEEN